MTKIRLFPFIIGILLFAIVFTQITGHLSLSNGAIENIFRLLRTNSEAGHLISYQYLHLIAGNVFDLIHWMGGTRMAHYVYMFSFIFVLMPLLPLPYYFWKRKDGDHAIAVPLIIASLIYSFLDLHLFSEHVFGISVFLILMAGINYSSQRQSNMEKALIVFLSFVSYLGGLSFIWLAPCLFAFSWKMKSNDNKKFLFFLCSAVAAGLIYTLYRGMIEPLNIRPYWVTVAAKFNIKLLSFGLFFHLLVLASLFGGLVSHKDKRTILICALAGTTLLWFDWTMVQYINQRFQDANVLMVTIFSGIITFVGFWNVSRLNVALFYPLLAASFFGTFWLQSHHKIKITSTLNQLYNHCSGRERTKFVEDALMARSYSSMYVQPNLSIAACLLNDVKPKYVLGRNVETIELDKLNTENFFMPEYVK